MLHRQKLQRTRAHRPSHRIRRWTRALLACLLVLLAGCVQTRVAVQLEPDGLGARRVEIALSEQSLDDLELTEDQVRALLDLDPSRGWTTSRENRVAQGANAEPHLVFRHETKVAALEGWSRDAADLSVRLAPSDEAGLRDGIEVEVGRGAGYHTLAYRESLDARSVKAALDRFLAARFVNLATAAHPDLDPKALAELRGLVRAHLSHYPSLVVDDEEQDSTLASLVETVAPQAARIIEGRAPTPEQIRAAHELLRSAIDEDDLDEQLAQQMPGLSLLAFMTVEFEISVPGRIVDTNADRVGEGYAAWEREVWSALERPIELWVHVRRNDE